MTDPQLPPPAPYGSVPPVPQAPASAPQAPPAYQAPPAAPAYHQAAPLEQNYQTPPGAYSAPVGGYGAPPDGFQPSAQAAPKAAVLGIVAFGLSLIAAVVSSIIIGIAGYQIGFNLPTAVDDLSTSNNDLSFLSPVRDQVLMGEISFWVGTLAGISAIVFGIMAIVKRQGRGWGIAGLIIGVIAPGIFFLVLSVALGIGTTAGAVNFYG
ncbi:hypothetical protein DC31_12390 [Microbacterium sp. CH12i]|uniref:hypothetical protein n=1 Tax=Microbacterium sp. CH12i TaxID=1479651 RepID=UPI000461E762|nr:hypothetical protein [Microbacterium sp. CH12i]KDA06032.1 hypothetical protein DC31_12390 [Microbacterium sp. CH12i]